MPALVSLHNPNMQRNMHPRYPKRFRIDPRRSWAESSWTGGLAGWMKHCHKGRIIIISTFSSSCLSHSLPLSDCLSQGDNFFIVKLSLYLHTYCRRRWAHHQMLCRTTRRSRLTCCCSSSSSSSWLLLQPPKAFVRHAKLNTIHKCQWRCCVCVCVSVLRNEKWTIPHDYTTTILCS